MILPRQTIKHFSSDPDKGWGLVSPFEDQNLRASSYDLTVGEEYYIGQQGDSSKLSTEVLKSGQSFTIPPHAVCFIRSAETIRLPSDITAKVSLRMTHIYKGLILSSQPPFDPGYHGGVVVMLNNLSSESVHLKQGERVATIEFVRLLEKPEKDEIHRSVESLEGQLNKPLVSSLTEIANMSAMAHEKVAWLSAQMLGFTALIVAVLAVPGFFSYSNLTDRLSEQRDQLKDMGQAVENYKRELNENKLRIEKLENRSSTTTSKASAARDLASKVGNAGDHK